MLGIRTRRAVAAGAVLAGLAASGAYSTAEAEPLLFSGSDINPETGSLLAASIGFGFSGNVLTIVLTNTSSADTLRPSDVLTGVFFHIFGDPIGGDPSTAVLTPGSFVMNGPTGPGGDVSGEWAYATGFSGPGGASQGISASGFDWFGDGGTPFDPGTNLDGPNAVNGLNYGMVSAGDNPLTGNTLLMTEPLINHSVTFTLTFASAFNPSTDISNVSVQYGTSLDEPNIAVVSEPSTIIMLFAGLLGLAYTRRRRVA